MPYRVRKPEFLNIRLDDNRVVPVPRWLIDGMEAGHLERIEVLDEQPITPPPVVPKVQVRRRKTKGMDMMLPHVGLSPLNQKEPRKSIHETSLQRLTAPIVNLTPTPTPVPKVATAPPKVSKPKSARPSTYEKQPVKGNGTAPSKFGMHRKFQFGPVWVKDVKAGDIIDHWKLIHHAVELRLCTKAEAEAMDFEELLVLVQTKLKGVPHD